MSESDFEWDEAKNLENQQKHGISFFQTQHAVLDKNRIIAKDISHSRQEQRYYCFGLNEDRNGILTVRFIYRSERIRIFGAGYWRKGKKIHEQTNKI